MRVSGTCTSVSTVELDGLVEAAASKPGCYGARLTGAGFGGCVVALADPSAVERLIVEVTETYRSRFGRETDALVSGASPAARLLG